jgi:hypothetical protein
MRVVSLVALPLLVAGALAAQAPAPRAQPEPPPPTNRSVWFDAGALLDHQIRAGFEGVTLGRYTFGLAVTYDDRAHPRDDIYYPLGYAYPQTYLPVRDPIPCSDPRFLALCANPYEVEYAFFPPRYRAWSVNLAARYYPAFFSFRNGASRMMVYAGGFLGFHWRVVQQTQSPYYYNPLVDTVPIPLAPRDTVVTPPDTSGRGVYSPLPPWSYAVRKTIAGLQPGLEIGVRLQPVGGLFLEAGGRFNLITIDDPMRRERLGDVESRLVIAAGFAW